MIHLVDEDIFGLDVEAIVNPINIEGIMGKGLALHFKTQYPDMYKQYLTLCAQDKLNIGKLFVYTKSEDYKYIINFPTKKRWRAPSKLSYIDEGLYKLAMLIANRQILSIAIPALGCGCGQLPWEEVYPCIVYHLSPLMACNIFVCLPQYLQTEKLL